MYDSIICSYLRCSIIFKLYNYVEKKSALIIGTASHIIEKYNDFM